MKPSTWPRVDAERHVVDRVDAVEVADEPVELQHRLAHRLPLGPAEDEMKAAPFVEAGDARLPERRAIEHREVRAVAAAVSTRSHELAPTAADRRHDSCADRRAPAVQRLLAARRQRTVEPVRPCRRRDRRGASPSRRGRSTTLRPSAPRLKVSRSRAGRKPTLLEVGGRARLKDARGEALRVAQIERQPLAAAGPVGADRKHRDVPREAQAARRRHAGGVQRDAGAGRGLLVAWSSIVNVTARPCTPKPSPATT